MGDVKKFDDFMDSGMHPVCFTSRDTFYRCTTVKILLPFSFVIDLATSDVYHDGIPEIFNPR